MRLIDIEPLQKEHWHLHRYVAGVYSARVEKMELEKVPTVDAAPVVHGRWTEQHVDYASDCAIDEIQSLKCSICGLYHTTPYMYNITHYKFCPNCGSRMDLEEQHENN